MCFHLPALSFLLLSRAKSRTSQRSPRCTSRTRLKPRWTSARMSTPRSWGASWLCVGRAPGCSSRVKPPRPQVAPQGTLPDLGASLPFSSPPRSQRSKVAKRGDGSQPARGSGPCWNLWRITNNQTSWDSWEISEFSSILVLSLVSLEVSLSGVVSLSNVSLRRRGAASALDFSSKHGHWRVLLRSVCAYVWDLK